MNISHAIINCTRKVITKIHPPKLQTTKLKYVEDADKASEIIYDTLSNERPCMIARFGSIELDTVTNYLGMSKYKWHIMSCILGETPIWWWTQHQYNMLKNIDYDICLIGCGAYGFHLAAHAKLTGHKAVHLGGSLQLLFGIAGKRWFDPNSNILYPIYKNIKNENWTYPDMTEKPSGADKVENGCYW